MIPLIDKPLGQFVFVGEQDDRFLVMTDYEAPNFRLILIDPRQPQKENWKTIIACLRGGSEYGEDWHRAAMFENTSKTIDRYTDKYSFMFFNMGLTP